MILNSPYISGSLTVTGNIITSGSITLSGSVASASYAASATSASYALNATSASYALNATTASYAVNATTASYADALTVAGTLTAQTLVVQTITSSVDYVTGSTRFGSISANTHQFTGSVLVSGSGTFTSNITANADSNGEALKLKSVDSIGDAYVGFYDSSNTRKAYLGYGNSNVDDFTIMQEENAPFAVGTSGSTRLTILGNGNVGIGTTSPVNKLDIRISDSSTYSSTSTGSALTLYNTSPTTNGFVGIDFISEPTTGNAGRAAINMTVTGNGTSDLAFSTRNTDVREKMRITSAGNIGIGTSDIVSTNLVGSVTIRKSYEGDTPNGATTQTYYQNQSPLFLFGRNSGISIISNNGDEGEIIFGNNSTRAYARISTGTGASAVGGDMYFKVGSDVERMRITTAGRIGIGTNNPVLNVDIVSGSADSIKLRVRNTNATGSAGIILNPEGAGAGSLGDATLFYDVHTTAWVAGVDKSDSSKYKIANDVYGDFRANNYFTITTGGNVGIGLTAPSAKLHVYGTTTVFNMLLENSTSDAYSVYQAKTGNSSLWQWGVWNNNSYRVGVSGVADYLTITSGGNVLVGQTTSDLGQNGWNLQSAGGGHTAFAINNNEAFIFNNRNTGTTYEIDFRTNAIERGKISVTDSGVSYITTPSDLNLKKNFENWNENVLDNFKNLNPQKFNFKVEEDDQPKTKGFIAQELVESFPEAYPKSKDRYFFNPSGMVIYLMKAIQELKAQNDDLQSQINELKAQ